MLQWFQSLIYGLVCGFTEFLPVSSQPHAALLSSLFGVSDLGGLLRMAVRIGVLLSLLLQFRPQIGRIARERKLAAEPPRRRKRQPDAFSLMEYKLIRTAAIPMLLGFLAYPWVGVHGDQLWVISLALVLNGIFIYTPQFMARANKDARHLTGVDALLIGLSGAAAVIPGVSRVAMLQSTASMRGTDRQYGLQTALLVCIPALFIQIILDTIVTFSALPTITFLVLICTITAFAAAVVTSYFSIIFIRFLSVNAGFSGFAYYSWGAAMLAFILYLAI